MIRTVKTNPNNFTLAHYVLSFPELKLTKTLDRKIQGSALRIENNQKLILKMRGKLGAEGTQPSG